MRLPLKKSTFGQKLIGGFLVVAFFAALVGGVGIINIRTIAKADTRLYEKYTVPIGQLQEMISSHFLIRLTLQELQYESDPSKKQEHLNKVRELLNSVDQNAGAFETTILTREGREHFKEFTDVWKLYKSDLVKAISLSEQGNRMELSRLLTGAMVQNGARAFQLLAMLSLVIALVSR